MTAADWISVGGQAVILISAVLGYLGLRAKQEQTHKLVNNRSDRQDARIEQLSQSLTDAGEAVPPIRKGTETSPPT